MLSHRKKRDLVSGDNESVVSRLLERLVSILLRLGFDSPRAESLIRQAFVFEAAKAAQMVGVRGTQSKIALLAGVNRLDVRRILARQNRLKARESLNRRSRVERILAAWSQDPKFAYQHGRPKPLTFVGANSQFEKLVRKYGRDVTARTLREDLLRNKLVAQRGSRLTLIKRGNPKNPSLFAAVADLAYLESHLAQFNFSRGRRDYAERNLSLSTSDSKLLKLAQRKAIASVEATLSSLESLQTALSRPGERRGRRTYRLQITTSISSESDSTDS